MAIIDLTTTLKGETGLTGLTGVAGLSIRSGEGTPTTPVAGSNNGDLYLDITSTETDAGRIYKREDVGDTETWVLQYDLSGAKGDTPVFGTPTVSTVAAGGTPTVTQSGTDLAPVLVFGLVTGATGASGDSLAGGFPTTDTVRVASYITISPPATLPALPTTFNRLDIDLTDTTGGGGGTFNKFNETVGDAVNRTTFTLQEVDVAVTTAGMRGGNNLQKYQLWRFVNTPGLTAAQSVTDLAATADGSAVVIQNDGGDVVDAATWNLDRTANGNLLELRDPDGGDLWGNASTTDLAGWSTTNVAAIEATSLPQVFTYTLGQFVLHLSEAYICILGYESSTTSGLPGADTTHWKLLT